MSIKFKPGAAALIYCLLCNTAMAKAVCNTDLEVQSSKEAGLVHVQVRLEVPTDVETAWNVITDYNQASRFVRNVLSSKAVETAPDRRRVEQLGWVGWGKLGVQIRTVYEVTLTPGHWTVRGKLLEGDVQSMEMQAQLFAPDKQRTVLSYQVITATGNWVPDLLAEGVLRGHARNSFEDLAKEMIRRTPQCTDIFTKNARMH